MLSLTLHLVIFSFPSDAGEAEHHSQAHFRALKLADFIISVKMSLFVKLLK